MQISFSLIYNQIKLTIIVIVPSYQEATDNKLKHKTVMFCKTGLVQSHMQ